MKSLVRRMLMDQRGMLNTVGLMTMGIAMIFLAVGFIVYPIILDSTDAIIAWTGGVALTIDDFTGLEQVVGIVPLLCLLGFVTAGAITGFMGFKMTQSGSGTLNAGGLMSLAIGLIFIAVGLIIFPVIMDGAGVVLEAPTVGDYAGLEAIVAVSPLIILIAFIAAGIVAGFFGVSKMRGSM